MRIEQANAIPMTEILTVLGYSPVKKVGNEQVFISPLLNDKKAIFQLDTDRNCWHDLGTEKTGKSLCFVMAYLAAQGEDHTQADAIRWLQNMISCGVNCSDFHDDDPDYPNTNFVLEKVRPLTEGPYNKYLQARGIPFSLAKKYLKEAQVANFTTGKELSALALVNENGGYHLANKRFKGWVAPKGVSVIRGSVVLPPKVHIFKNFLDFLAALAASDKVAFEGDTIILNSLSNLPRAFPYIRDYTYERLYSWLDNTPSSQKAAEILNSFCAKQSTPITCKAMNHIYEDFRDISSWHRHNLGQK